jgi:hypothetical protein
VRAEVLCGARNPQHRGDLTTLLGRFGHAILIFRPCK